MEQTFVMLKPNSFTLGIVGQVVHRIEKSKFKIVASKMIRFDKNLAGKFYEEHKGKPFFRDLIDFITSGPVLIMIVKADNAVVNMRKLIGSTDPVDAEPGTIRHDYAPDGSKNVIHASDSHASVEREKKLLFSEQEIIEW